MNNSLKILILEDEENDAILLQMYLKKSHLDVTTTWVSNKEAYIHAIQEDHFDVII